MLVPRNTDLRESALTAQLDTEVGAQHAAPAGRARSTPTLDMCPRGPELRSGFLGLAIKIHNRETIGLRPSELGELRAFRARRRAVGKNVGDEADGISNVSRPAAVRITGANIKRGLAA